MNTPQIHQGLFSQSVLVGNTIAIKAPEDACIHLTSIALHSVSAYLDGTCGENVVFSVYGINPRMKTEVVLAHLSKPKLSTLMNQQIIPGDTLVLRATCLPFHENIQLDISGYYMDRQIAYSKTMIPIVQITSPPLDTHKKANNAAYLIAETRKTHSGYTSSEDETDSDDSEPTYTKPVFKKAKVIASSAQVTQKKAPLKITTKPKQPIYSQTDAPLPKAFEGNFKQGAKTPIKMTTKMPLQDSKREITTTNKNDGKKTGEAAVIARTKSVIEGNTSKIVIRKRNI